MKFILKHLPVFLFAWFWVGLALAGIFAPSHRVEELNSAVIKQGWHLSAMAVVFGSVYVGLYIWRSRAASASTRGRVEPDYME